MAKYAAKAYATGGRESGTSRGSDGRLDVELSLPNASGDGTNPEQSLATSAMEIVGGQMKDAPHPDASLRVKKFSGKYTHRTTKGGVGHNLPQEASRDFAEANLEVDGYSKG